MVWPPLRARTQNLSWFTRLESTDLGRRPLPFSLIPSGHPYTPIGRNKTFRATETDDDDNDEAASNAEAIDSATAERSNTHKVMRIKQEYIPDQGTHHPSYSQLPTPDRLFDESDVDDDDEDDDYSVRSDDDRKIPAPTRPKSTRKRQFDDSDVPASP
ncbi:hypothetical protein MHU86_16272 [Fragilaria crotonensis]|nr:hypothetical protein MHU86_16272 [Fragilaria crotonensis]